MTARRPVLTALLERMPALRTAATAAGAMAAFAAPVRACPYCSLSQGVDTLLYILAFLAIPYAIVTGVWLWMKHVLASEHEPRA